MKIKKFFEDYGYTVVKLITTHIAMSIFGLMAYLPTGKNVLISGLLGVATVVFYFFMVNNDVSKIGAKDSVRTVRGKNAAHPAKGFIIGAISAIPDFIICGLYVFFWYFQSYEWAMEACAIFAFTGVLWEGIFMGLTGFIPAPVVFSAIPFLIIIFSGVSYILGMNNINLIPLEDNPEEAERKREAKKNKKKFSLSLGKQKDAEEEDEDEDELI
jgi:hypothetical protein